MCFSNCCFYAVSQQGYLLCWLFKGGKSVSSCLLALPKLSPLVFKVPGIKLRSFSKLRKLSFTGFQTKCHGYSSSFCRSLMPGVCGVGLNLLLLLACGVLPPVVSLIRGVVPNLVSAPPTLLHVASLGLTMEVLFCQFWGLFPELVVQMSLLSW